MRLKACNSYYGEAMSQWQIGDVLWVDLFFAPLCTANMGMPFFHIAQSLKVPERAFCDL